MFNKHLISISAIVLCSSALLMGLANGTGSTSEDLDDLHAAKVDLLEEMVARYEFGYSKGSPVLEDLLTAKFELLNAELAVAKSTIERIKLRESMVENREQLVEAREAAHQLGNIPEVDILKARVAHLDAKIALRHERASRPDAR